MWVKPESQQTCHQYQEKRTNSKCLIRNDGLQSGDGSTIGSYRHFGPPRWSVVHHLVSHLFPEGLGQLPAYLLPFGHGAAALHVALPEDLRLEGVAGGAPCRAAPLLADRPGEARADEGVQELGVVRGVPILVDEVLNTWRLWYVWMSW